MSLIKIDFAESAKKSIFVTWTLHNFCNYRCSYCPPGCNASTKRPYGAEEVIAFARRVIGKTREQGYEHFTFAFSGGEPTLFPGFEDILKTLYSEGVDVTFTSNGSRPLDFWKKNVDHFNHCVWSYHPEMAKTEEFVEKAAFVTQHCWLNVDLMMSLDQFENNIELGRRLSALPNIRVDYVPVQKEFGGESEGLIDYSPSQLGFLQNRPFVFKDMEGRVREKMQNFKIFGRGPKTISRKIGDRIETQVLDYKNLISNDENQFKGWKCFAGIESLIVNMDGSLYRAYCYEGGKLGTIWDEVSIPGKPVTCTKERCKCSVDIEVSKFDRRHVEAL